MNKSLNVIIVDDLELDRENLRLQLQMIDDVNVVAETNNIDDARRLIFKHRPDIVFLDIKLPEKDGFDLLDDLKELPEIKVDVVFVTAYSEFAAKAFRYYPFSFLEKPADRFELAEIIKKYRQQGQINNFKEKVIDFKEKLRKLHFVVEEGHIWIEPDDILWCKADRNYSKIYLKTGETVIVTANIGKIQEMLNSDAFFRVHRSFLVNIKGIVKINSRTKKIEYYNNPFIEKPQISKQKIEGLIKLIEKHNK